MADSPARSPRRAARSADAPAHDGGRARSGVLEDQRDALLAKAVELALDGHGPSLKLCLERLEPPAKGRRLALDLPALASLADVARAQALIAAATGSGAITTEEGAALSAVVAAAGKAIEASELEDRIAALERRLGASGGAS